MSGQDFTDSELRHIHECLSEVRSQYDRSGRRAYLTDANPSARTRIERILSEREANRSSEPHPFTATTALQRRMAEGHRMRTGHNLSGHYVETDAVAGIYRLVRTCCDESEDPSQ